MYTFAFWLLLMSTGGLNAGQAEYPPSLPNPATDIVPVHIQIQPATSGHPIEIRGHKGGELAPR